MHLDMWKKKMQWVWSQKSGVVFGGNVKADAVLECSALQCCNTTSPSNTEALTHITYIFYGFCTVTTFFLQYNAMQCSESEIEELCIWSEWEQAAWHHSGQWWWCNQSASWIKPNSTKTRSLGGLRLKQEVKGASRPRLLVGGSLQASWLCPKRPPGARAVCCIPSHGWKSEAQKCHKILWRSNRRTSWFY